MGVDELKEGQCLVHCSLIIAICTSGPSIQSDIDVREARETGRDCVQSATILYQLEANTEYYKDEHTSEELVRKCEMVGFWGECALGTFSVGNCPEP